MVGGTEGQEPGRIGERRRERKGQEVGVSRGQETWREMKKKNANFCHISLSI